MANWSDYYAEARNTFSGTSLNGSEFRDIAAQYATDAKLAADANQREVEMWKMQQEYNTPAAQMARLKEAGLNPNLAYQMANSGNASSAPGVHKQDSPNFVQARQTRVANAMSIINGMSNVMQQIFGVISGAQQLDAQRMDNEVSAMRLNTLRRLSDMTASRGNYMSPEAASSFYMGEVVPRGSSFFNNANLIPYRQQSMDAATRYRNYYTNNLLPLMRDFTQGRINGQNFTNTLLQYQSKFMQEMSPWERNLWLRLNYGLNAAKSIKSLF